VIYVGNDVNDLDCMRLVGCAVAVADAHPRALACADIVLSRRGGHGAVRELCDLLGPCLALRAAH
jgi:N-acylneuraminate cytidylyltransferase